MLLSEGSTCATPKSVAAQTAFPWPASSFTWLNGVPVAEVPGNDRKRPRSFDTKVSAASLKEVRSVAAHTPPGQLKTAPTRLPGKPKLIRSGSGAPSARKRTPSPDVPRYQPRLSNERAAAV